MLSGEGEQCQMTRSLDGNSQPALVLGTGPGLPPGLDLAPLSEEAADSAYVFVVNRL
jgi:hypothetical protein